MDLLDLAQRLSGSLCHPATKLCHLCPVFVPSLGDFVPSPSRAYGRRATTGASPCSCPVSTHHVMRGVRKGVRARTRGSPPDPDPDLYGSLRIGHDLLWRRVPMLPIPCADSCAIPTFGIVHGFSGAVCQCCRFLCQFANEWRHGPMIAQAATLWLEPTKKIGYNGPR
jgi:hypothetical protein